MMVSKGYSDMQTHTCGVQLPYDKDGCLLLGKGQTSITVCSLSI